MFNRSLPWSLKRLSMIKRDTIKVHTSGVSEAAVFSSFFLSSSSCSSSLMLSSNTLGQKSPSKYGSSFALVRRSSVACLKMSWEEERVCKKHFKITFQLVFNNHDHQLIRNPIIHNQCKSWNCNERIQDVPLRPNHGESQPWIDHMHATLTWGCRIIRHFDKCTLVHKWCFVANPFEWE